MAIIAMSFFAPPGLMAAISIGILGFGCSNILLSGAATIFLPVFLFILYYDLEVSLGWKSWVLAGSGALILLIRKIVNSMPEAQKAATDEILASSYGDSNNGDRVTGSGDGVGFDNGVTGSGDGVTGSDLGVGSDDTDSCNSCKKDVPWKYHRHVFYGTCIFIIFAINVHIIKT